MSDPNYNSVSLLLHFDGANGSTTFTDNSPSPKTVTRSGDAQISTAQSKFGGASAYFDGNGDYLSILDDAAFDFGSGDFTIECWVYVTSIPSSFSTRISLYSQKPDSTQTNAAILWYITNGGYLEFQYYFNNGSGSVGTNPANPIAANLWTHVAVTRSGNSIKQFINGYGGSAATVSSGMTIRDSSANINIGRDAGYTWLLNGYIDDYRVTKGVARYTSDFTPPTSSFPDVDSPKIRVSDLGPLGVQNTLVRVDPIILASNGSPLGEALITAQHLPPVLALVNAESMLGVTQNLAWHLFARADVPSMLGAATSLAVHDFTSQLGDATTYYVMDLTTPGGTVRVPISSWQATLQTGLSNYVQCVVPAAQSYVTQINAATQFKILRQVTLPSNFVIEYQMASGPLQTVTLDQGPFRYTATIAGYSSGFAINETPDPAYNRTMQGLRSVSVSEGKARVRCSIDWLLRPSQRVFAGDRNFIASYINYYVGNNDAYMEVGER